MDNFHIIPDLAFQICELGGLTASANDPFSLFRQLKNKIPQIWGIFGVLPPYLGDRPGT